MQFSKQTFKILVPHATFRSGIGKFIELIGYRFNDLLATCLFMSI